MTCWEGLEDPRTGNAGLHDLYELLTIVLCTVLCGEPGAVDIALFAKAKESFLRTFVKLYCNRRRAKTVSMRSDIVQTDRMDNRLKRHNYCRS